MMKSVKHLTIVCSALMLFACSKQTDYSVFFNLNAETDVANSVVIQATISCDETLDGQGLLYSTNQNLDLTSANENYNYYQNNVFGKIVDESKSENRQYTITNLAEDVTYYYRLFAVKDGFVKYSVRKSFKL
ncbi:MAG: hypothetical protein R3279_11990 [Putridiphycobacter sp.]|nr:hypothetical protein [Putridiphycobacter sp.]